MIWELVINMEEIKKAYKVLGREPHREKPFQRLNHKSGSTQNDL
jgi:hypothetical protein